MPIIIPHQMNYQFYSWRLITNDENRKERKKHDHNQHKHALKSKQFFKPIK